MYIIQMSDLHIIEDKDDFKEKKYILLEMLNEIKDRIQDTNENVLCCICGDFIDNRGKSIEVLKNEFEYAEKMIDILKKEFKDYNNFKIGICPGNHDCCKNENGNMSFDLFEEMASNLDIEEFDINTYKISIDDENTDFIFTNSTCNSDYKKGHLDYASLEKVLKKCRNQHKILCVHHTLMSMDEKEENPSIINSAKLIQLVDKYNIQSIMHGHTHGVDNITIGKNNCSILGVGALFSRGNDNVNSQFNIYEFKKGFFLESINYKYNKDNIDAGISPFTQCTINAGNSFNDNHITGDSISQIYNILSTKVAIADQAIYNVRLYGTFNYEKFKKDVEANFSCVDELGFTYRELAEMWEQIDCPNELYFNHGQYFNNNGRHAIEDIKEHLQKKNTSSRAVLSTFNTSETLSHLNDDYFLPSFMSIQFSFHKNNFQKIYVSVNLRALEVSRFLKINICEILYLLEKLADLNFNEIELTINAFRVQNHNEFKCFLKAKIDTIPEIEIVPFLEKITYLELAELLEDKRITGETFINQSGMELLLNGLKILQKYHTCKKYDDDDFEFLTQKISKILNYYEEIKSYRKKSSIDNDELKSARKDIDSLFDDMIEYLTKKEDENNDNK